MNNIENIISHIKNEAEDSIKKIRLETEKEVNRLRDDFLNKTRQEVDAISKREAQDLKNISERSITSSEIKKQKIRLSVKNDVITDTIEKAKDRIINLPIDDYVDMLKKLYMKNIPEKDAKIRFNKKDLDRLPKDLFDTFVSNAKSCKVEIAKEPVNIDGGFIVDFGDVIWNMSISSLIDQNIESITDKTNKIIFG